MPSFIDGGFKYLVEPHVCEIRYDLSEVEFEIDKNEVGEIFTISTAHLLDPNTVKFENFTNFKGKFDLAKNAKKKRFIKANLSK